MKLRYPLPVRPHAPSRVRPRWRLALASVPVLVAGSLAWAGTPAGASVPPIGSAPQSAPQSGAQPAHAAVAPAANGPDGVAEIYPTAPDGQTWYLSDDPNHDPRFDPQATLTHNSDGSWRLSDDRARMGVYTSTFDPGSDEGQIETDQSVLADRGYMAQPDDWKNVEITGYVKNNDSSPADDDYDWYARGYHHTDDHACWGTAYKSQLKFRDGSAGWQKELSHTAGYTDSLPSKNPHGSLAKKWVGFKAVMYNVASGVKLEIYADYDNNNTWTKVYDYTDDGGWAIRNGGHNECNGADDQVIDWGGPLVGFRWDSISSSVDFEKLSVREIAPSGGGSTTCGTATRPTGASATGDDGNVPGNAIDGSLSTRWSASPVPQAITVDLGSARQVCGTDIAWYQGSSRTNTFSVETSQDGKTFSRAYAGKSAGNSAAIEHYVFSAPVQARYIRVTVTGNTDNNWASISEISAQVVPN